MNSPAQVDRMTVGEKISTSGPKSTSGLFWFGALAFVLLILLHQSLFMGKGLLPADVMVKAWPWHGTNQPSNIFLIDQYCVFNPTQEFIHQNGLPLWNPDLCCGVPNLGAIQNSLFFPIRLLLSPLDPFTASGPYAFIKLCLAGWFMMLFVRLLGASNPAAFLSGMVFSLSGFMILWLGHPHVATAMWIPLLLYLVEKPFRQPAGIPALRIWTGFALAFACMILAGHPPTAIHVALFTGIYFLIRLVQNRRDGFVMRVALFAAAIIVGMMLAAPQILPFLEYNHESSSQIASASVSRWDTHMNLSSLIHFLLPNALGNPALGHLNLESVLGWFAEDNFHERTGYVGILPLFFAVYALVFRRCNFTKIFGWLSLASLLVILGTPPVPSLLRMLPVLRDVNETRLLLVLGFCLAVLAGLGWDAFAKNRNERRGKYLVAGFCVVVGAAFLFFWHVISPHVHELNAADWAFLRGQMLMLGGGVAAAVLLAFWPGKWSASVPIIICMGWTAVDLLCFGYGYNPAIPRDLYFPRSAAIDWLQKDKSQFRIFGSSAVLPPDSAEVFGLQDTRGCDYMTVRRYEELVTGKAGDFFFYEDSNTLPVPIQMLNAKYVLWQKALPPSPPLELVYSNEIFIYRYKEALDRALVVYDYKVADKGGILNQVRNSQFDARKLLLLEENPALPKEYSGRSVETNNNGSVQIFSYKPDDIHIEAKLPRPGFLLLLDTYFPGWKASVNGQSTPIYRADYNFRAVPLPSGSSSVEFEYRPQSLRDGLVLCVVGTVLIGVAWVFSKLKSKVSV